MKLWLDTEFNEFKGDLISMALVGAAGDEFFYEALHCEKPGLWVAQHVMPVIGQAPVSLGSFQATLQAFLSNCRDDVVIVADWPDDIRHFCEALILGPGLAIKTPERMTFVLRRDLDTDGSQVPHNALHDAWALREADTRGRTKA